MRFIPYIVIAAIITFCFSCEEKFINDIEIDAPEQEQKLVINLELKAKDTLVSTFVARTTNINEAESTFYKDAFVELYKDDILLSEMVFNEASNSYEARFNNGEITEDSYRIEVSGIDNLTDITASQTMPSAVNISKGTYQEEGTLYQEYGYTEIVDEALIKFDDPVDQENYYHVQLYLVLEDTLGDFIDRNELYISTINPFAEDVPFLSGVLIRDNTFNGSSFDLSLGFFNYTSYNNIPENVDVYLIAELNNITRDNYLYLKSISAFESSDGNPFAEPVIVHNNIEEGIGIFRASNPSKFRIDIE